MRWQSHKARAARHRCRFQIPGAQTLEVLIVGDVDVIVPDEKLPGQGGRVDQKQRQGNAACQHEVEPVTN